MEKHDIDLLVSRNSGGTATVGKIIAARRRGIPVIMLQRPAPEAGERSSDLQEILEWIARKLD
jgi:precorrin-6A/cobalt-precorrin-6A reductase